jgi:hypothetical protein
MCVKKSFFEHSDVEVSIVILVFVPEKSEFKNQLACFIFSTMYFTARCGKISRYLFKMSGIHRIYRTVVDKN